jgi:hypothetical protein
MNVPSALCSEAVADVPAMLADVATQHALLPAVIDGDSAGSRSCAPGRYVAGGLRRLGGAPAIASVWVPNVWQWAAAHGIWELSGGVPIGAVSGSRRIDAPPPGPESWSASAMWGVDPLALLAQIGPRTGGF